MSQENVEIVKEFTRLFEKGDRDEWREHFDPDVVWDTSGSNMPAAGVFHGHEGMERFFRDWLGTWREYEVSTREYLDGGDSVVVVFHQRGTGRESGVQIERDFFGVYEMRGSKVVRYRLCESREEALEAAGLTKENVELQHQVIDDFNRRDLDAYLALVDPDVEFTPYEVSVQGGDPYRGHDGVRKWWRDSFAVFTDLRAEVYEVRDLGSITLVRGCLRGQGAESGAAFERTMYLVAEWRTRKIVWWGAFASEAEALEAAGLAE